MPSLIPAHVDLEQARPDDLKATAVAAVEAAPQNEKKDAVAAAAETLTNEQKVDLAKELAKSQWPTGDPAKVAIYITGFIVAGIVLCLSAFLAWKAQDKTGSISSDIIVAASSFVSLLLGGLVGAYVQK
jgi:hypothetical protein